MLDILEKGVSEKSFKSFLETQPEWLKEYKNNVCKKENYFSYRRFHFSIFVKLVYETRKDFISFYERIVTFFQKINKIKNIRAF